MKQLPTLASVIAGFALAVFSASCGTDGAPSGGAPSARSGGAFAEGKRLYLTRCTSCHAPEPVGDYTASEWRQIIPEMAIESKLTAAQERAVLQYVLSGG